MKTGIAYFGVRNPEFVKVDLNIIAALSYSHILHTYSEEDLHYYEDTMKEIIDSSNRCGLKVYVNPWGVGRVFGGEAYSELAARNPEWAQRDCQGRSLVAACPNHPGFRAYMKKWLNAVGKTAAETVFWDEPHFFFDKSQPRLWACTCEVCQKEFRRKFRHSMPNSITESVREFREESLLDFLKEMTAYAASLGKRNSVCLLPHDFEDGIKDWERFVELPHVDEVATDPYWKRGERLAKITQSYHEYSSELKKLCDRHGKECQIWIKNYDIQKNNEESVLAATWAAFNEGVRNMFAWSYKGSSDLSWLRCDDPEKVWELQSDAFLECRERLDRE